MGYRPTQDDIDATRMRESVARGLASTPHKRFQTVVDSIIDHTANRWAMARQTGDPDKVKKLDRLLSKLEKSVAAILAEMEPLMTPPRAIGLTDTEREQSLAAAVEGIAKVHGAGLWRIDTLAGQVALHAPAEDRNYWAAVPEGKVSGLLRGPPVYDGSVPELLKTRGILTWFDEPDQRHRVVDVNWLTSHADIRDHVVGGVIKGKRCSFCRIHETPNYAGFIAVDPTDRQALAVSNDVVQLRLGVVYVHTQCLVYWHRWVGIAARYATQEAAEEADRLEGREPRVLPEPPSFEPDAPPEPPPAGYEPTTRVPKEDRHLRDRSSQ